MTTTIAVLNSKGGSGKSTISVNLAHALHQCGHSTLLIDTDPQGSASDWHNSTEDNPLALVSMLTPASMRGIGKVVGQYDYAVIDGESKTQDKLSLAIRHADFVVIPIQPSGFDLWGVEELAEMVTARQDLTGKPGAAFLINRAVQHTKLGGEIAEALTGFGLPIFRQQVRQRQAYPRTTSEGLSIFDSGNSEAISEFRSFTRELLTSIEGAANGVRAQAEEA